MVKLTDKQKEVFDFIVDYGPTLTISSIARNFKITQNAALSRVQALYKKGYITMKRSELVNGFELMPKRSK
jgi:predicted DNA-binding transcriptional regulator